MFLKGENYMKKQIIYVTGNKLKVDYLNSVLGEEFDIVGKKIDCPEIQADNVEDVARFSAKWASEKLGKNVLKNDSGLIIPVLNGFPSAYTKYVEETLGPEGILDLMKEKENRHAYYLDAFAYCELGKEPVVFFSKTNGKISLELSGDFGHGYDKIFIPEGKSVTMGNLQYEEFLKCFDNTGALQLAKHLKNK